MITRLVQEHQLSERRACRLVGLSRDSYRHPPVPSAQTQALKDKIVEIAHVRRRFGYRRVHDLLRADFPGVNHKRVYRLYSAANLAVRKRKKAKRPPAERTPLNIAKRIGKKHGAILMFASALLVGVSPVVARLVGVMPDNGTGLLYGLLIVETVINTALAGGTGVLLVSLVVVHPGWTIAEGQFAWLLLIVFTTLLISGPGALAWPLPRLSGRGATALLR